MNLMFSTCDASGEEAVVMLRDADVDLVFLDMVMNPGINGRETYEQIAVIHPGQKAIIISGYAAHEETALALEQGMGAMLKKPYTLQQRAYTVRTELMKRR